MDGALPGVAAPSSLADLERITDFFLPEAGEAVGGKPLFAPGVKGAYCYYGTSAHARIEGTELEPWVSGLCDVVRDQYAGREDFRVIYDGVQFRACRDLAEEGPEVALRRLPATTPLLTDLIIQPSPVPGILLDGWLNGGGMVLLAALTGQGKSTTAAALIKERLMIHGGRCVTVEDPIELPLAGLHGPGSCRQFEVRYDSAEAWKVGFAGGIRRALRKMPATRPAIIFVGEIRDTETAAEAVKAALAGALLVATIHAESRVSALQRLIALAETDLGESASMMVGGAIRAVIHQELFLDPTRTGWGRGVTRMSTLFCNGDKHSVALALKERRYAGLTEVEAMQTTRLGLCAKRNAPTREVLRDLELVK